MARELPAFSPSVPSNAPGSLNMEAGACDLRSSLQRPVGTLRTSQVVHYLTTYLFSLLLKLARNQTNSTCCAAPTRVRPLISSSSLSAPILTLSISPVLALTVGTDGADYHNLLKAYSLDSHLAKMAKTSLPTTYAHFLRGVGENKSCADAKGDLVELLQGVPFDRPIEPFPESLIKSALQLPPASKSGPKMHKVGGHKQSGLVHKPPMTASERAAHDDKVKASKGAKEESSKDKKEKKEKKKEKRKREDGEMLQKVLAPLVAELRTLTWAGWIVNGKAANPFIQKITKDNCKRLGVPNYFDFVKEPMDLTRLKEKNDRGEYSRIDQFTHDIKLMVANAKTFNRVGEPVHQMAVEIEQLYESKVPTYSAAFEAMQAERKKRKKEKKKDKKKKKDKP
jgi:hypothetical protein